MRALEAWRERTRSFEVDVVALYLACRDPRVPWYAKALAAGVAGYAFSPIDLIPDSFPSWATWTTSYSFPWASSRSGA